ncbi:uncharacterized protein [Oryza sativa Japonica Group]|uniref:uncharacterized protein n=1 Tax=Oryza sativa subsp. japonica TaxID=39947 RepID=UPI00339CFD03
MVQKANGKWRMCVDFTDLNKACPKDHFPLPRIDQLVDSTAGCELLSFLDAYSGYHQISMAREDEEKTAFITPFGVFCYVKMPFGLITAGNTFQRTVQGALSNQLGNNVEAYVDDIVVKTKKSDSLIDDLRETFDNLRQYRLMLNPQKCTFGVPSGKLLGFLVSGRGIEANPEKIKAIENMKSPARLKEVLADFVADWTMPDNQSGNQIDNETWIMAFDGALNSQGAGTGFILTSPSGDQFKHAIHLNFRATNNTAEYEGLLAGIRAAAELGVKRLIVKWDSELVANQVHKDYKCSNPELSKYLVYRKNNIEPDDLARHASRREPLEPGTFLDILTKPSVKEAISEINIAAPDISSEVTEAERATADIETTDDWRTPLIKFINSEELPEDDAEAEKITCKAKIYCMIGNDLYKKAPNRVLLKCVSSDDGRHLLLDIHEGIYGSHAAGRTLVGKAFRQGFFWPTALKDTCDMVQRCEACQFHSKHTKLPAQALQTDKALSDSVETKDHVRPGRVRVLPLRINQAA